MQKNGIGGIQRFYRILPQSEKFVLGSGVSPTLSQLDAIVLIWLVVKNFVKAKETQMVLVQELVSKWPAYLSSDRVKAKGAVLSQDPVYLSADSSNK